MKVEVRDSGLAGAAADVVAVGLFEDGELPAGPAEAPGAADAKGTFKRVTTLHAEAGRVVVVGLGKREDLTPERARVAAALAAKAAAAVEAKSIAWDVPDGNDRTELGAALVTGTILAGYRFQRFRETDPEEDPPLKVESLTLLGPDDLAAEAEVARIAAEAQNRARELQDLPANVATPTFLADRAREVADEHASVTVETLGRAEMEEKGMGGLVAVSQGTAEEPQLIILRYSRGGSGPTLGLVGKAVTFDTGGISLKPSGSMHEMKMDMSGGAVVLEAVAAIAELGLEVDLIAAVPATENMPSGTATRPGDIITQYNGKTVEVNNTDAEGRLILADALAFAVEGGAERLVDLATLTGAVLIALGSTYAALVSNDDALAAQVAEAAERTGELAWRLPLHAEYKELTKGTAADLTNASEKRKAGTIYAASFLEEFVDERPWVHLDIAGTAWDVGREYAGKGPTGYGVRLLVELVRAGSGQG